MAEQQLLDQIRKQVAVGTLAPLDVLQAETNIARNEERILVADNAMQQAEDRLKRVMNFSLVGERADVVIVPADPPMYTDPALDQDEQIRQALEQRADLIQAKLVLENQHIGLVFDKNQALPTLDLEASLRLNGIDNRFCGSFAEIEPTKRYAWGVGVTFRYPLQNRQAKSRVQQSELAIRQQMVRIKDLEENIIAEVRNAFRDVLTNAQRVQASRIASRLAQKQLEAEEKKLQVGLATVFTTLVLMTGITAAIPYGFSALAQIKWRLADRRRLQGARFARDMIIAIISLVFSILFIWYSRNTGNSFWVYWAPFFLAAGAMVLGIPVYRAQRRHMTQPGAVPPYR